jgi:hypothetical protein
MIESIKESKYSAHIKVATQTSRASWILMHTVSVNFLGKSSSRVSSYAFMFLEIVISPLSIISLE